MLESVALISGGGGYYPDSGPGPKSLLRGDTDLGYFGRVTQEELFTPAEIRAATNPMTGDSPVSNDLIWVKFFYKGRVLYYPTQVFSNNVTFNTIYAGGVAFGVRGPGPYPGTPPVEQLTLLTKTDTDAIHTLLLRLPKSSDSDESTLTPDEPGELFSLLPRVFATDSAFKFGTQEWDNLNIPLASGVSRVWTSTQYVTNANYFIGASLTDKPDRRYGLVRNTLYSGFVSWMPVLELILPGDYAFDVEDVATLLEGIEPVSPNPARTSQAGFLPVSRIGVELIGGTEPVFETGFTDTILNLKEINTEVEGMTDPVIAVEYTDTTTAVHGFAIEMLVTQPQMTVTINKDINAIFGVILDESPIPVSLV